MLEKLKAEATLSHKQYGGIRGSSTEHFLIDTWNNILGTLEEKDNIANLVSVDFQKAFNRMHHYRCLEALSDLGASPLALDWVAAFLHRRQMSVKIGIEMSDPRTVPGGSPQGSISGNFLFCSTTNQFADINPQINVESDSSSTTSSGSYDSFKSASSTELAPQICITSTPSARGKCSNFDPELDEQQNPDMTDTTFRFFRPRLNPLDSSSDEGENVGELREWVDVDNAASKQAITSYVYIDDYNSVERIDIRNAIKHITTDRCNLKIRAPRSEVLFEQVGVLAETIGMRVNQDKT